MEQADAVAATTTTEEPIDGAAAPAGEHRPLGARATAVGRTYWPLLVVAVVALGVRLWAVYAWMPECTPSQAQNRTVLTECYAIGGDAYHYNDLAAHIADGRGFTILSYATFTDVDVADHPPAYPLFLALLDVLGLTEMNEHRLALCFVGTAAAVTLGLVGWRLGGRATGVVAGLVAATYPGFWMSEAYYMSESLFVLFVALALLAVYRFWRRPGWMNAILAGAAGGLAWLTRGEAAVVLGLTMVGFVLFSKREALWRKVKLGLVACAVCIAMMVPWVAYNLYRFPEPIYIAATGTAFALNSCDEVWYGDAAGFYSFGCLYRTTEQVRLEDGEVTDAGLRRKAVEYQRANLDRYPAVVAIRIGRLFGGYEVYDTYQRNVLAEGRREDGVKGQQIVYYALLPLGAVGLYVLRRRRVPLTPLVAPVLATAATVAGTFAIYRYRLTADTALIVAGSAGAVALVRWLVGRARGRPVALGLDPRGEPEWAAVAAGAAAGSAERPDEPVAVPVAATPAVVDTAPAPLAPPAGDRPAVASAAAPGGAARGRRPDTAPLPSLDDLLSFGGTTSSASEQRGTDEVGDATAANDR
ncbi:MAG: glycosyltransferase family 39 protein [Acidimicrobiales bacterium]